MVSRWVSILVLLGLGLGYAGETVHLYATKVQFANFVILRFTDIELTPQGEQHLEGSTQPGNVPFSETYLAFHVAIPGDAADIRWMIEPAQAGPIEFELGGKRFRLELFQSEKLGTLEANELVVWRLP